MIELTKSTVFNTEAQALVNTVNTTGTMGAGIALEFSLRYPAMFDDYKKKCEENLITTGKVDFYYASDGKILINFPTKQYYLYPSKIEWIEAGLQNFVKTYQEAGVTSAAFPKLGCSNGKLDWSKVRPLMIKYLDPLDIRIFICEATKREPEGIEKQMVDSYNLFITGQASSDLALSDKQADAIFAYGPVRRFYEIRDIPGIKGAPYKKIYYKFFPSPILKNDTQFNLFDLL